MKLLVTGGTGFIGKRFCLLAKQEGFNVSILTRKPVQSNYNTIIGTLKDNLINFKEFDCIVNLAAASTNVPYLSYSECLDVNCLNIIEFAQKACNSNPEIVFYHAGSCFEYGPLTAKKYNKIPANAELNPIGSYQLSKACGSKGLYSLAKETGMALSINRFFHVYGTGELATRFYPLLVSAAQKGEDFKMSSGEQVRDFINVNDATNLFLNKIKNNCAQKNKIHYSNIATGEEKKLKDFAIENWKILNAKGNLMFGECDIRKNEIMYLGADLNDIWE